MKTTTYTVSMITSLLLLGNIALYGGNEGDGNRNVYYGKYAGESLRYQCELNLFMGFASGYSTKGDVSQSMSGSENVYLGSYSGHDNISGNSNTFTGTYSGSKNTTGNSNTFTGTWSGYSNSTGNYNTFLGYKSGYQNTTGYDNTFNGVYSGYQNTTGSYNIFLGYGSGNKNTIGSYNTFNGVYSGYQNTTGSRNTFLGYSSGNSADINSSVLIGYMAGYNATRDNTLYIANSNTDTPLIYGEFDTGVVKINGELNTTKTITASFSGSSTKQALKMIDISVNNSNSAKKSDVGFAMTNTRENFTWSLRTWEDDKGFAISKYGNGATKEFRLYDTDPTDAHTVILKLANGAYCDGTWHGTSTRTMKQDIKPLDGEKALEAFQKLQPVTYAYKTNPTDSKVGFIAEDVPELVADPGRKSLSAMDMVALLTKVVQVQEKNLKEKDVEIAHMKKRLLKIESLLSNLSLDLSSVDTKKISRLEEK